MSADWILDGGYLPLSFLRQGVRYQLRDRKKIIATTSLEEAYKKKMDYVSLLRSRPIAIETAAANEQHYEVGTGVLAACLGPRMKYSCCLYPKGNESLAAAEIAMLDSYIEKADLKDGQSILDLGYASQVTLLAMLTVTKMWMGICLLILRRKASWSQDHSILEFQDPEAVYRRAGPEEGFGQSPSHHGRCRRLRIRERVVRPSRLHRSRSSLA